MDCWRRLRPRIQARPGAGRISKLAYSARRAGGAALLSGGKTDDAEKGGLLAHSRSSLKQRGGSASGEFPHGIKHVIAGRRAGGERFQKQGGGKMRGRSLEADVQKFTAVTPGQGGHGAGNFFLLLRTRTDDERLQAFELPAPAIGGSPTAAARNPAKIIYV